MIHVMFLCNDSRNGHFLGRLASVHIDDWIELDGPQTLIDRDGNEIDEDEDDHCDAESVGVTEFVADDDIVAIGSSGVFPHKGYREWVGNWCWDCARMEPAIVVRMLNALMVAGWDCHSGASSLFQKWKARTPLTVEDLEALD